MKRSAILPFVIATLGCAYRGAPATGAMLPATSTVRINVINFTTTPAAFIFRFGGVQLLDTIAPAGSLPVPLITRSLQVAPGAYSVQLLDKRSGKLSQLTLTMASGRASDNATIELLFDAGDSRLTSCYCVRMYGGGGGGTPHPTAPPSSQAAPTEALRSARLR
jgi:hypothetical protein